MSGITREEFIAAYCERGGLDWAWLSKRREVLPCDCGEEICQGWQMVPRDDLPPLEELPAVRN